MKSKLLLIILLFFGFANAQNVFRDDFASYAAPLAWSGTGTWSNSTMTGMPGTGGCAGAGCVNSQILASPVSYAGYGSSANAAEIKQNSDGVGTFFTAITTPDIYVGMVVNISNTSTAPQDHFRVFNNGSFVDTLINPVLPVGKLLLEFCLKAIILIFPELSTKFTFAKALLLASGIAG